ncbi:MAG: hypothetical protein QW607_04700 [Desulfurococcaceae archaeon]
MSKKENGLEVHNQETEAKSETSIRKQADETKGGRKKVDNDKKGISLFTAVLISILSSVISLIVYHYFFAVKIAVIDLSGYLLALKNLYIAQKISDEELKARMDAFVDIIKQNEKKYIILNAESVLGRNRNIVVLQPPSLPADAYPDVSQLLKEMLKNK